MNAKQKIKEMLKTIYPDGEVNAMSIWKGYDARTGRNGWHFREFGRSNATYLGKSIADAKEFVADIESSRE